MEFVEIEVVTESDYDLSTKEWKPGIKQYIVKDSIKLIYPHVGYDDRVCGVLLNTVLPVNTGAGTKVGAASVLIRESQLSFVTRVADKIISL